MGKLIKSFIRVSLLLLPVSLVLNMSSCIKEEPVPELVDDGSIIFLCEDSKPATKTTLKGLQTEWVEGSDQVGLFSPQASVAIGGSPGVVNEPLTALSSGVRSQFSGSVYWNTGDHDFYSYYPYVAGTPPYTAVPVSLPAGQTQSSGNDSSHIGSLDFLVARPYTAKYPGSDGTPASVSLRYNHLFSIIEFQIIRSSGLGVISKVKLSGKVPLAFDGGFIDLSQATPQDGTNYVINSISSPSNSVTVSLTTAITPTNNYSTTPKVYMVILPGVHSGELSVGFEVGGVFYEISKLNAAFERGKKYIIQVDAANATLALIKGSDLKPVTINGITWAPVNAGYSDATKYGLYYQWHRKYGQGANTTETPSLEIGQGPVQVTIGNLYENRNTFFKNGSPPYDWCVPQQEFWNMADRYNPCPEGWRVPTESELSDLITSGDGSTWVNAGTLGVDGLPGRWFGEDHSNPDLRANNGMFLPASGTLSYATGSIDSRGGFGQYASSRNTGNPRVLLFSQSTNPYLTTQPGARGLSVRCVKNSTQLLPIIFTEDPFEVIHNSVKVSAIIEDEGSTPITEKGIVYAITVKPTTSKSKVIAGSGPDNFTVTLTGLVSNTIYYLRSYAINSNGISYGTELQIRTTPDWGGLQAVTIDKVTWAPVNAGYDQNHFHGLLYQWGRKYGQGYNSDETPSLGFITSPGTNSEVANPSNKDKFYKIDTTPFDSFKDQGSSWSQNSSYNPCPDGWIVPTIEDFNKLIGSGSTWVSSGINGLPGRWFGEDHATVREKSVFLPFSGYRNVSDGNPLLRNSFGYYWTTTTRTTYGAYVSDYFALSKTTLGVVTNQFRGMGYSVRCIQKK